MSTEDRLARLGLLHLKDKPEELKQALDEGIADYDRGVAAWHEQRARLAREALEQAPLVQLEAQLREFDEELAEGLAQGAVPSPGFAEQHARLRAELERRRP